MLAAGWATKPGVTSNFGWEGEIKMGGGTGGGEKDAGTLEMVDMLARFFTWQSI